MSPSFVALDFETADQGRDSACAVGLVRVEGNQIVARETRLIRPPRRDFLFTYIHGISWKHVAQQPEFGSVWADLSPFISGVDFFAAHNAVFDRAVLRACCEQAAIPAPSLPFECTVRIARKTWAIYPTTLPHVCRFLNIDLDHHNAASDAEACAKIVIEAHKSGNIIDINQTQKRSASTCKRQASAACTHNVEQKKQTGR